MARRSPKFHQPVLDLYVKFMSKIIHTNCGICFGRGDKNLFQSEFDLFAVFLITANLLKMLELFQI